MIVSFNYVSGTTRTVISTETGTTDFYNLKNKSEGARRYGYTISVIKFENPEGQVAYQGEYQTTLNGSRYQSSKGSNWTATPEEAAALLVKTVAGAMKRYAKLAQDPANKIEHRA